VASQYIGGDGSRGDGDEFLYVGDDAGEAIQQAMKRGSVGMAAALNHAIDEMYRMPTEGCA